MGSSDLLLDFIPQGPVPVAMVEKYRGRIPDAVIHIWEQQGFGSATQGFLKVINPDTYLEALQGCLPSQDLIPLFATGLADVIVYNGSHTLSLQYRYGTVGGIGTDLDEFGTFVNEEIVLDEFFEWQPYPQAVAMHGPLAYDECFCYTPLLALGGPERPENLIKGDLITHVQLITQLTDGIDWS